MATPKRKQGETASERPKAITKRKPKQEETKLDVPQEVESKTRPAVTFNIQSWATPIVGLIMLVIGLLVGYYVRPLTLAQSSSATTASLAASPAPSLVTPPVVLPTTDQAAAQKNLMASVVAKVRHFKGDPNAPVTIIEFGDFQCPFCGRFFAQTEPQMNEQYIQSGKVRFGYFNFSFLGPESNWAAEAAECASDQNKFWEYHDKLYNSQSGENQGAFNKDNLKKFAQDLGFDTQAFNNCLDSGKYTSLVQADTQASSALGVQSTPTFLINGQTVIGAQPFQVFQQAIDPLLK
ncbi:MAG: DsbA family protein [Chloroflexi bacterium]|nr:DsbA family protein [Chloroflexota bacterium]